jgi:hypothetical protein
LLAPDKTRHGRNNILLKGTDRSEFGDEIVMQFLEGGWIFSVEKGCPRIATMFHSGMNLTTSFKRRFAKTAFTR